MTKKIAILGAQNGDESKGGCCHRLSPQFDWVIRPNASNNCGHTIYRDGKKYAHNLLPSIDFRHKNIKGFLASGMVIDLEFLVGEIEKANEDFEDVGRRIYVDPDAFLVLPEHKEEDRQKNGHIGTTNKGIGPAYAAKVGRRGFRIKDVMTGKEISQKPFLDRLVALGVNFKHVLELEEEFKNSSIIFEGAQGILLSLTDGTYPYVTCSDPCVSGIYSSGFNFIKLDKVYGVAKVYNTKVGNGVFPGELVGEEADKLRELAGEYGVVSKRPRRIGVLDLPALNYAVKKGGITHLIVAKFDILEGCESIKVCKEYDKVPVCPDDFFNCVPVISEVPGWKDSHNLSQVQHYIEMIEQATNIPVEYISCGVEDKDFIKIK